MLQREQVDQLYVALPLDEHVKMLALVESANRELLDIKVVPDLLQMIALRARLEDLDGIPIINLHDVPLRGFNAVLKRIIDVAISGAALLVIVGPRCCSSGGALVRLTSSGPALYHQERMSLDGKRFWVWKLRSMHLGRRAGDRAGLGRGERPARHPGRPLAAPLLRRRVAAVVERADRRHVAGRAAPRAAVLRRAVQAPHPAVHAAPQGEGRASPGWAQVNGWRGNTSLEKRIEYDLYYIENWSVGLDLKIIWLTLIKGLWHKHAY